MGSCQERWLDIGVIKEFSLDFGPDRELKNGDSLESISKRECERCNAQADIIDS